MFQSYVSSRRALVVVTVLLLSVLTPGIATSGPFIANAASGVAESPTVAGAVVSVQPARIADSRSNQQINGAVPASGVATVQATGQGGVPASGVSAVLLNVTAVSPQTAGFVTVWPSGIAQTATSNLNFQAGQSIPNTVIVPVGADGKIKLFNGSAGTVQLLVDVGTTYSYSLFARYSTGDVGPSAVVAGSTNGPGNAGTLWSWGRGDAGSLGRAGPTESLPAQPYGLPLPGQVGGLARVNSIAAAEHTARSGPGEATITARSAITKPWTV
jgi:hypothetical protein